MHTPNFEKAMELLDMLTPNDLSDITSQIINSCKKKIKTILSAKNVELSHSH